MNIKITENHGDLEDFYIKNGLELEKGKIKDVNPIFSIIATENGELLGCATVSERFNTFVLDYIAVDEKFRRRGIAKILFDKITENYSEFYLTAKVPKFFSSVGCRITNEKPELLSECLECTQYLKNCRPVVFKFSKGE